MLAFRESESYAKEEQEEPLISAQHRAFTVHEEQQVAYLESILPVAPSAPPMPMPIAAQPKEQSTSQPANVGTKPSWGNHQQNSERKATPTVALTPDQLQALARERAKFYQEVLVGEDAKQSSQTKQPEQPQASSKKYPNFGLGFLRAESRPPAQAPAVEAPANPTATRPSVNFNPQQQTAQQQYAEETDDLEFMTRDELIAENRRLRSLVQEMVENVAVSAPQTQQQQANTSQSTIKYATCGHCNQLLQVPTQARIVFCPICSKYSDVSGTPTPLRPGVSSMDTVHHH